MKKPDHAITTLTYHAVKAKKLKKNDRIALGGRSTTVVVSNNKNAHGERVVTLQPMYASRQLLTLIVPSEYQFRVTRNYKATPKDLKNM